MFAYGSVFEGSRNDPRASHRARGKASRATFISQVADSFFEMRAGRELELNPSLLERKTRQGTASQLSSREYRKRNSTDHQHLQV